MKLDMHTSGHLFATDVSRDKIMPKRAKRKNMQSEWFEDFARAILKEKGVNAPDEAVEKQLIKDISEATRDVVLKDLLNSLNKAELEHFEAAIDADDEAATHRILADKQPVVTESLQRIRLKYLGRA